MTTPWFDREEILAFLLKRVEGFLSGYRQNIALLGPEGVGKSTLVKRFLQERLPPGARLAPIYLEVQEGEDLAEWAARFAQSLLYGILRQGRSSVEELPQDFAGLLKESSSRWPQTCAQAQRLLVLAESGKADEAFDRLWDLLQTAGRETGVSCLVVLDEFDRMGAFPVKDLFGRLGRRIMVQDGMMFLAVSSRSAEARSILREGLNLLFGQFETVCVGPLDSSACLAAMRTAGSGGKPDSFREQVLIDLAQGYPARLDLLLKGSTGSSSLPELLERLLLDPGTLRDRFEAQLRSAGSSTSRNRRVWLQVLSVIARGNHRISEIAVGTGRSASQVLFALQVLQAARLVEKQGSFHRIPDRLFQLWMRAAFPVLQGTDWGEPAKARVLFRNLASEWLDQFRAALVKPLERHAWDLLERWTGERVEIEGRRVDLPHFHRIERAEGQKECSWLWGRRQAKRGKDWLVIPRAGALTEADAHLLVRAVSNPAFKGSRKVVLGSYPVEVNARVILQQARIRCWDLEVLNRLLDLYGLTRAPAVSGQRPYAFEPVRLEPATVSPPLQTDFLQAT